MSQDAIILVEDVSKRFSRNEFRPSLRHEATELARGLFGGHRSQHDAAQFFALRHVSFTVHRGEAVGILGRNGSGKTTLLRLLSSISDPSSGRVEVREPSVSLIGLGAGFITSLTGRQNIYLNGAMLGMSIEDIESSLDRIIEFSELNEFIDLPANRYSSGMLARLGFSIAIHALTEIIFLDEVLAVGDTAFQEKCIERMEQVIAANHTLVFVSHSEEQVQQLCPRSLLLDHGELVLDGPTEQVIEAYHAMTEVQ